MTTECIASKLEFQGLEGRRVEAEFNGGQITSDAGGLLLREVENRYGFIRGLAACFGDRRDPRFTEFSVEELVGQRIYGLALGYEDLNDHEELRTDPLMAVLVGKEDPLGRDRRAEADRGKACAGKSTLNRLELSSVTQDKYRKTPVDEAAVEAFLVEQFIRVRGGKPKELVLDLDATDDPLHGEQEGRFYHGYYRCYCYLPLYVFCEGYVLGAKLRVSNLDGSEGAVQEMERIVGQLRAKWPKVRITLRADSSFAREALMKWCEEHRVDYVFGLARNQRLEGTLESELEQAQALQQASGSSARVYKDFRYQTHKSWSQERRVVGKAEYTGKGSNPRFVVTSLGAKRWPAQKLYEQLYCARGEAENRIKEQQLELFADRTSTHLIKSNQLRLWFSSVAYNLLHTLRRVALKGTQWAKAQCQTIRLKLLKIGGQIRVSVRRVSLSLSEGYPYQALYAQALAQLQQLG